MNQSEPIKDKDGVITSDAPEGYIAVIDPNESGSCEGCAFEGKRICIPFKRPSCLMSNRDDNTFVIFKKINNDKEQD